MGQIAAEMKNALFVCSTVSSTEPSSRERKVVRTNVQFVVMRLKLCTVKDGDTLGKVKNRLKYSIGYTHLIDR